MNDIDLINWASEYLGCDIVSTKERYGDQSSVYKLSAKGKIYYLKIAVELGREHDCLLWLHGRLSVPKVLAYTKQSELSALLLSEIKGQNLAALAKIWPAEKIAKKLALALKQLHGIVLNDCASGGAKPGEVLIHGDACLPNFIFQDEIFSGYLDLGAAKLGLPEEDLSAAVWSLHYNLGPGYGELFLKEYGLKEVTPELVAKLRSLYL